MLSGRDGHGMTSPNRFKLPIKDYVPNAVTMTTVLPLCPDPDVYASLIRNQYSDITPGVQGFDMASSPDGSRSRDAESMISALLFRIVMLLGREGTQMAEGITTRAGETERGQSVL